MPNPGVIDHEPYDANDVGLVGVLKDLKETMANQQVYTVVGYRCEAFENVTQGDALYCRESDGKVGKAIANDTLDKALVAGFAQTTKSTGQIVQVVIRGLLATSGLDEGNDYYLSAASSGAITKTAPSTASQYLTRIGEAANSAQLIIKIEPPILLR
tara:strand:+ start:10041 stop:10511 length:471 start_codon:yes stop_codon:yes gene_type:complete